MRIPDSLFYIKTNRVFTSFKKFSWLLIPLIALGGLFIPKLGLLLIPILLTLITLGFFKGKHWCGNLCPHGSLFDSLLLPFSFNKRIPALFKSRGLKALFFTFYMSMFVLRIIRVSSAWGSLVFFDKLGFVLAMNYLIPTTVGTFLAIFVNPRAWCSFCPMGTMEQLAYKLGKLTGLNRSTDKKVTILAKEMCHLCGKCSRVCPMQLKPFKEFSENNQLDNENCIRCTTCVENCPAGILRMDNIAGAKKAKTGVKLNGYEKRRRYIAAIKDVQMLTNDIKEITFKLQHAEKIECVAGQFILVKVLDEPEIFRAFSISGFSPDKNEVRVTVKKMENGLGSSQIFNRFHAGDTVELEGPTGNELVIDKTASKILLVAGGIGITPFLPVVADLTSQPGKVREFSLLYGVNKASEFIYDEFLQKLAQDNPNFKYLKVVASPDANWQGYKGFVTDVMKELDLTGYKVYMCGPKPMVNPAKRTLSQRGVQEQDIFVESA